MTRVIGNKLKLMFKLILTPHLPTAFARPASKSGKKKEALSTVQALSVYSLRKKSLPISSLPMVRIAGGKRGTGSISHTEKIHGWTLVNRIWILSIIDAEKSTRPSKKTDHRLFNQPRPSCHRGLGEIFRDQHRPQAFSSTRRFLWKRVPDTLFPLYYRQDVP